VPKLAASGAIQTHRESAKIARYRPHVGGSWLTLKKEGWRNRITGHGEVSPESLLANPLNWRTHPKQQRDALEAAIDRVGFVQGVIVNTTTGHVVDGHLRVDLAMQRDEPLIAVDYVALSPEDEAIVLATLDPLSALAGRDQAVLDDLLAMTGDIEDGPLAQLLGFAAEVGFPEMPTGERGIRQMTFTVTEDQQAIIEGALSVAKSAGAHDPSETGNENSNGNALAFVCAGYEAA